MKVNENNSVQVFARIGILLRGMQFYTYANILKF